MPNPIFNLTPAATVDEGNNWINISWGPLAMTNPVTSVTLGNYALTAGSPAINYITTGQLGRRPTRRRRASTSSAIARKANNAVDVGAVEFQAPPAAILSVTPSSLAFGSVPVTTPRTTSILSLTVSNTGSLNATGITLGGFPRGLCAQCGHLRCQSLQSGGGQYLHHHSRVHADGDTGLQRVAGHHG